MSQIIFSSRFSLALATCVAACGLASSSSAAQSVPPENPNAPKALITAPVALAQATYVGQLPASEITLPAKRGLQSISRTAKPATTQPAVVIQLTGPLAEAKIMDPTTAPAETPQTTIKPADTKSVVSKPDDAKTREEQEMLEELEAGLNDAQERLDKTSEKLSAGQKELLALSNTLRTVMLAEGEGAAGLHPFVRVASRYAGTPYVWGGESRYGFDCSGFIIRVMRDLGYKALPHSAAEQFKYGRPVAQSLLKPGDIVFFANTYKPGISHVGIYIGKRRFIHAASTREGTIVSSLDASPYRQKYAGARRLIAVRNKGA